MTPCRFYECVWDSLQFTPEIAGFQLNMECDKPWMLGALSCAGRKLERYYAPSVWAGVAVHSGLGSGEVRFGPN